MVPKPKELPPDFDVREAWEELRILLDSIDKDLKKAITKGTKRSGVNARKGLMYAKDLIANIYHGSLQEQKEVREKKPPHGNASGAGIRAMHEARKRKQENYLEQNNIQVAAL